MRLSEALLRFAKDAQGHEHKGPGEGGGQFTSSGTGGSGRKKVTTKPVKKFGKSKAAVNIARDETGDKYTQKEVDERIAHVLGKDAKLEDLASLVGAPDNAKVVIYAPATYGNPGGFGSRPRLQIRVDHPDYHSMRTISRDDKGDPYIYNSSFFVHEGKRDNGIGSEVFGRQVENAVAAGIKYIKTDAARGDEYEQMNGYYTWPRFGYDTPIDPRHFTDPTLKKIRKEFPAAKTLQDVMKTEEGRNWWKKEGVSIEAKFDLTRGSRSLKVLAAYQKERDKRPPKGSRQQLLFRRRGLAAQLLRFEKDAAGHEHKPSGPGGGQFTSTGGAGNGEAKTKKPKHPVHEIDKALLTFESLDTAAKRTYPLVKKDATVDGREVIRKVDNEDSIEASVDHYDELPGIREVQMDEFSGLGGKRHSSSEDKRVDDLAAKIKESGKISVLIVVEDGHPDGPYILEGSHRIDALARMGAKSFPAKIVLDYDGIKSHAKDGKLTRRLIADPPAQHARHSLAEQLRRYARYTVVHARYTPWRPETVEEELERYRAAAGEHWVTIGAQEGEDGKKHGGSPVLIDGAGNIKKGNKKLTDHKSLKHLLLQAKKRGGGPPEPTPPVKPKRTRTAKPPAKPPTPPPPPPAPAKPPTPPPAPAKPQGPQLPAKANIDFSQWNQIEKHLKNYTAGDAKIERLKNLDAEFHATNLARMENSRNLEETFNAWQANREDTAAAKRYDDAWKKEQGLLKKVKQLRQNMTKSAHAVLAVPPEIAVRPVVANTPHTATLGPNHAFKPPSATSQKVMREATAWLEQHVAGGLDFDHHSVGKPHPEHFVTVNLGTDSRKKKRAFHSDSYGGIIVLSDKPEGVKTAIHEFGHHMETRSAAVREAAQAFLDYRLAGEAPVQLKKIFPDHGYKDDEYGRKDHFDRFFKDASAYYVGKQYAGATEIVSMGMQAMYDNPTEFARADPEYFKFISAVMDGTIR